MAEFGPVTCAGCGLLCDDVTVRAAAGDVRLLPECELGAAWFSQRIAPRGETPAATIEGKPADVEAALSHAAALLRGARRPLVHGFDGATVQDARAALALADRLGAVVSTAAGSGGWAGGPAGPLRGWSTATLGEIRDRCGLIVIWREDPETSHPRLLDRLGLGLRAGRAGRASRGCTLIVIDDRDTRTAGRGDAHLRWAPGRDLEALAGLRLLSRGLGAGPEDLAAELSGLMERISGVAHVAFVHGPGLTGGPGGQRRLLGLHELIRELCHERHAVTLELPRAPGLRSADDVLAWQTGYPAGVDLASGHPELLTTTGSLAAAEEVDVCLRVESPPVPLPDGVAEIVLSSLPAGDGAHVSIRTAAAGVHAEATAHRLDGVPLALQAPLARDAPTAAAVLTRLSGQV